MRPDAMYAMLCHASHHAMPYYVMLQLYAMLCHAMLRYATLCYAMLRYATLCYAMLRYATLCYAMLCYAMLCYAMLGEPYITLERFLDSVFELADLHTTSVEAADYIECLPY